MSEPAGAAAPGRTRVSSEARYASSPRTGAVRVQGDTDVDAVYAQGLIRAQLRLALGCVLGFVVCAGVLALVLLAVPSLDRIVIAGVPLPWLLHAYGFYPIIVVFAMIYVRSATRNEKRFRMLRDATP